MVDALGRTMLLPTDMEELKNMRMQEVFLSVKRYLGMVRLLKPMTPSTLAPRFSFIMCLSQLAGCPSHYRLEEEVKGQSKSVELERNKRIEAAQTLKNSEANLTKAREDLKEMTRAKDSVEAGLASAQKQAED